MCSIEIISFEVVMTFISRKTRLLVPHFVDESDPGYLYYLNRKRSDGRLKRHSSCDDLRAWVDDEYLNYQYLLELMSDGELQERPFSGLMGRFIPVEAILDILCGKASEGGDSFAEWGNNNGLLVGLKPKPGRFELYDSVRSEATDDLLKLANSAVTKLEAIRYIVCTGICKEDESGAVRELSASKECVNRSAMSAEISTDEYTAEYNTTLTKIACLRQRLRSIQERRDELNEKIQSSPPTKCQPSSGTAVTELYNREEQSNAKRSLKKIEKLIAEKGEVLQEMCTLLKYLNELKKNANVDDKQNDVCPCACPKLENSGRKQKVVDDCELEKKRGTSKPRDFQENKMPCRKFGPYTTSESSQGSSEAIFMSVETLPVCDSQRTYNVPSVRESIPDRKFKSETSMTEVEQTLRSYEQRLSELSCLESDVEELKKKAEMSDYFKKRWLRSMKRGRCQKAAEENMKRDMESLCRENCELKKMVQRIAAESEKEHGEMQRLRCKAMKLVDMQKEMMNLRKELTGYQLSCESQNECIARLENTIREQRDEIDRLMTHMTRLCRMTEKLREVRKPIKKSFPRSRSYGPERQNSAPGTPRTASEAEEEMQHSPCCGCNRHNCNTDALNRPRSECGRRMPDRCCESLPHQQTCRNKYRYN